MKIVMMSGSDFLISFPNGLVNVEYSGSPEIINGDLDKGTLEFTILADEYLDDGMIEPLQEWIEENAISEIFEFNLRTMEDF